MSLKRAASLYFTRVMHRRTEPRPYRFVYKVFSLLLDIDRLEETAVRLRLLSHNQPNLFAFYDGDHGPRDGTPLRPWIEGILREHGIELDGGQILLLCFPRLFGYTFNPLSIWYCLGADGAPRAVLCEVHNTFGENHSYLLHTGGQKLSWPVRDQATKRFHVSPLMALEGRYRFRLSEPGDDLAVFVQAIQQGRLLLSAAQVGQGEALTDRGLIKALARTPLMTFKVVAAIHWQALKIWLRGTPFYPKPEPPKKEVTS